MRSLNSELVTESCVQTYLPVSMRLRESINRTEWVGNGISESPEGSEEGERRMADLNQLISAPRQLRLSGVLSFL